MARIKNQHTYSLQNCQGGTAIDLSDKDNHSIIGFCPHNGSRQAWIFQQDGDQNEWFIKSSYSGKYLGIEGKPQIGTTVVVVSNPFRWDVRDSDVKNAEGIRILVHGTSFSLDLSGYGNSANHTKIQLWGSGPGANQIWALTERVSVEDQHTYSLKNRQGGTAVDLSGADNYTIIGYRPHYGLNQAWIFQQDGNQNGWFIKSSQSGKYLGIKGNPKNGTMVVVVSNPFRWDVRDSDVKNAEGIRILVHGTKFSLDLSKADHTKIQLWGTWPGANQIWAPTERVSIEDQHTYSLRNCHGGTEDQSTDSKILPVTTTVREAFITGDLSTAEKLLTQEIEADAGNHISYANRSLVMARKLDWARALQDAVKSLSMQPSLIGYIAKGSALCGQQHAHDARTAFDLAFTFANGDSKTTLLLFLIKAIALFNANEPKEAMMRVKELAAGPSVDPIACLVVKAYLQVQLGTIVLDAKFYDEAVEAFAAAVKASNLFAKLPIHTMYEEFAVFFGWDLKSLWQTANMKLCIALLRAGKYGEGLELYLSMMEASDEATKASTRAWFAAIK